jgi:hypothetical protein
LSTNIGSIVMTISAIDEASGVMGKISASLGLVGSTLQTLGPGFSQLGQVIQGFAVGGPVGAAIVGIGEVVKGLQDSVAAAATLQTSWTDVQSVMHLTGAAWDSMKTKIDAYVESLRTTTTFSDTQLIDAFQRLVTYGMSASQAMDALKAATEIATAKHIDLTTAATALGKAFQGNSMLLVRYGIDVATVAKTVSLGTEAIKEMAVNLKTATGAQVTAFSAAMTAAGLAVNDATGKMLSNAAILKEITAAWKSGTIDATQLTAIVGALGITFDGNKALAMDYAAVLGQVNTQYGGAAAAQASTYAGLQERLGNAVQVLSEKIGTMLLPALSSILEGLLPIVDAFGRGVGAIQNWLAEVAKMPAVKAATDAVSQAFAGLWDYAQKNWNTLVTLLTPAIKDLLAAFQELWNALSPIGAALSELFNAIFGGTGDFDIFKAVIEAIILPIKGLTELIRLLVPVIHWFATGFKEAADIILPPLEVIRNAVGGFLTWLSQGFQAFYDWLVGHSLWVKLWDMVTSLTLDATGKLISMLASALLGPLQNVFTEATNGMQKAWSAGLDGVKTTLSAAIAAIETKNPELANVLKAGLDALNGNWQGAFTRMGTVAKDEFGAITNSFNSFIGGMRSALDNAWSDMQRGAASAMQSLQSYVTSAMQNIINAANNLWNTLTHHSIWPNMMAEMVAQTRTGMAAVQSEFVKGFESPTGIIPTIQSGGSAMAAATPTPSAGSAGGMSQSQALTIPIIVNIDGQQVAAFMERRLVDTLIRDATRSKRH